MRRANSRSVKWVPYAEVYALILCKVNTKVNAEFCKMYVKFNANLCKILDKINADLLKISVN